MHIGPLLRAMLRNKVRFGLLAFEIALTLAIVAGVPAPLSIGTLRLSDGRQVHGFLVEPLATEGARDISEFGGWRAFVEGRA